MAFSFASMPSRDNFTLEGDNLSVGSGADLFEYQIIELTDAELAMIYLARGNVLHYERVESE